MMKIGARGFRRSTLASALLAAAACAGSDSFAAAPTDPYGCACLHNQVGATIRFRYKWGLAEWNRVSLAPGRSDLLCWPYKGAPQTPSLTFEMDVDMTAGKTWQTFSLRRAPTPERSCDAVPASAQYHVGFVANSNKTKIRIFDGMQ